MTIAHGVLQKSWPGYTDFVNTLSPALAAVMAGKLCSSGASALCIFSARMLWIQPQLRGARGGAWSLLPIADRPRVGPQRVFGVVVQICGGVDSSFSRLHRNAHAHSFTQPTFG